MTEQEPDYEDIVIKITWQSKKRWRSYKKTIKLPNGAHEIQASVHYGFKVYHDKELDLVEHHGVDTNDIRKKRPP